MEDQNMRLDENVDVVIDDDEENDIEELCPLVGSLYPKHTKSIFSLKLVENKKLLITGGEDDQLVIQRFDSNYSENDVVAYDDTFKDSVTAIDINKNGNIIAGGDMAGNIHVYNMPNLEMKNEKLKIIYELNIESDLQFLVFSSLSPGVLISGSCSHEIWLIHVTEGKTKILFPSIPLSSTQVTSDEHLEYGCTNGKFLQDGTKFVCAYSSGDVMLWDLKLSKALWTTQQTNGKRIISLELNKSENLLCIGETNAVGCGSFRLVGMIDGKCYCDIQLPNENHSNIESVEKVCFVEDETLNIFWLSIATLLGRIFIYDVKNISSNLHPRYTIETNSTITSMDVLNMRDWRLKEKILELFNILDKTKCINTNNELIKNLFLFLITSHADSSIQIFDIFHGTILFKFNNITAGFPIYESKIFKERKNDNGNVEEDLIVVSVSENGILTTLPLYQLIEEKVMITTPTYMPALCAEDL
ncbi:hypothetical protein SNEBB_005900 [Seison nebaliae]|nr:hypothetical protein SNEBB_005900 [Seison nebaliae]